MMIDFKKEFHTDRLYIRPSLIEDVEEMFTLTQDQEKWIYFTSDLSERDILEDWVKAGIDDETRLALTIIEKESGKIVGSTSIGNISKRDRRAEIGWTWLANAYKGKGYNKSVKLKLLQYLFEECGMQRVELKTDVLNIAARKGAEKAGFVEEGILRSHTQMVRNRRRDSIFYSVLREEWIKKEV